MPETDIISISDLLAQERVHVQLPCTAKEDVLNRLVDMLEGHPDVRSLEGVREAVFQREELMSTGVGRQLALPHAKTNCVSAPVAAFAITARPIEFEAMDDQPIRLAFLLISPQNTGSHHIKLLSRISRLMYNDDFRHKMLNAQRPQDVVALFEEGEQTLLDE